MRTTRSTLAPCASKHLTVSTSERAQAICNSDAPLDCFTQKLQSKILSFCIENIYEKVEILSIYACFMHIIRICALRLSHIKTIFVILSLFFFFSLLWCIRYYYTLTRRNSSRDAWPGAEQASSATVTPVASGLLRFRRSNLPKWQIFLIIRSIIRN